MGGHRNLEYAFWANEQTLGSAVLLVVGGIIGVIPYQGFDNSGLRQFSFFWSAIYSLIVGLLVIVLEYPRGKRQKGSAVERRFQSPFSRLVSALGPLTRNYFCRFIGYFLLALPACCLITTFLGGMVVGSLIYLVSALKGEQWHPVTASASANQGQGKYVVEAPQNPPPRRPVQPSNTENNSNSAGRQQQIYALS